MRQEEAIIAQEELTEDKAVSGRERMEPGNKMQ